MRLGARRSLSWALRLLCVVPLLALAFVAGIRVLLFSAFGSPTSLAPDRQVLAELATSRGLLVGAYLAAIVVGGALLVFLYRARGARRWPLRAVWCGAGGFIAAGLALLPSPIAFLLWGIAAVLLEQAEAHTYAAPGGSSHAS